VIRFPPLGVLAAAALPVFCQAQPSPELDIRLTLDFSSAEQTLELYEGRSGSVRETAALPGSRLALAATALLSGHFLEPADLERALDDARFGTPQDPDVFSMDDARRKTPALRDLLGEIRRRNVGRRVAVTVAQMFPSGARVRTTVPVYVVAFGPQTIDAFVQRVVWREGMPVFSDTGELTIVLNLARAVGYGTTTEQRLLGTLSTVAHEVFHAAFEVYQDSSDVWRAFHAGHRGYAARLLELTQNEGIAHYLSFEQRGGYEPSDWDTRVRSSMEEFNGSMTELLSPATGAQRAGELLRSSNTSTYWESYGAITGLFIAREIDRTAGRPALVETVAGGPLIFFAAYDRLCERNSNLPRISPLIRRMVGR
jgi:hypothetical protein